MEKSATVILTNYFNVGEGKRSNVLWLQELRALSDEEKLALARGVCAITGETLKEKASAS